MPIISGRQVKDVEIEISDREINHLARNVLLSLINLPPVRNPYDSPDHYLKDGNVMKVWEEYTSHSWTERTKVREATPLDIAVFTVLDAMKTKEREKNK